MSSFDILTALDDPSEITWKVIARNGGGSAECELRSCGSSAGKLKVAEAKTILEKYTETLSSVNRNRVQLIQLDRDEGVFIRITRNDANGRYFVERITHSLIANTEEELRDLIVGMTQHVDNTKPKV